MSAIRILVVDDHELFRRGLVALLSQDARFAVVGQAGDAGAAQRLAGSLAPDLILLDNHLPGVTGVDALPSLIAAVPGVRVLMLTVSEDAGDLAAALRAGACGYLLKTVDSEMLTQSIVRVIEGESVVSPEMTGKLVAAYQAAAIAGAAKADPVAEPLDTLSPREQEILTHIARGSSNKEIGRALEIADTTVKIHVQHILRKLKLGSRLQAAVYATERLPRV